MRALDETLAPAVVVAVRVVRALVDLCAGGSRILPKNPDKKRCVIDGCRAWSMRGSDLCASHAGRARGGAPVGNVNRLRHGLYSKHYSDEELALMLSPADDLQDEIALCRVLTGRMLAVLGSKDLDAVALVKLSGMALRAANVTARLLRANQVISGDAQDDLAGSIGAVLDQLSAEWGVAL